MTNPITALSRAELNGLASGLYKPADATVTVAQLARALLAVMDAKPDYYVHRVEVCDSYGHDVELRAFNNALDASKCKDDHGGEVVELFTTPAAPCPPDGWIKES